MGFFSQRCPNCGKKLSAAAEYCNSCGCPTGSAWSTCPKCGSAVGSEAKFCWHCGTGQEPAQRQAFYGDRWHRDPGQFAARIELALPEKVLHRGLQVDEGCLALLFQDGRLAATLEPGHHQFESFLGRFLGFRKDREAHAVLLDTRSAEVDFDLEDVRVAGQVPVDLRLRLLFQVTQPELFVQRLVGAAATFATEDFTRRLSGEVREAAQTILANRTVEDLLCEARTREILERDLLERLAPTLAPLGVTAHGLRLARLGGAVLEGLRGKFGEIDRLNRELEASRRLQDLMRQEKVDAFRNEEQVKAAFDQVSHELGLQGAEREQERRRFLQAADQKLQLEGLRGDNELRQVEIRHRLEEQKLRQQSELDEASHEIQKRQLEFAEDLRQQRERFAEAHRQQREQAALEQDKGRQAVDLLRLVQQAQFEADEKEAAIKVRHEEELLRVRGAASLQALLATMGPEQGDRLLKLAELEMRKGLSAEQALALVAEKSPEIAPAVAEALKARYLTRREAADAPNPPSA